MRLGVWLGQLNIEALYIEPGSPWENGYAESFQSGLRDEFLATDEFESLSAVRNLSTFRKNDYNHQRPHSSLGYVSPTEYAARLAGSATPQPPLQQVSVP